MRIIHFTDFHAHWPWFEWAAREGPRYDLAIHSGDFINMRHSRIPEQAERIKAWSESLRGRWIICSGNHEADGLLQHPQWIESLSRPALSTDGGRVAFDKSEITASGWRRPLTHPLMPRLRWITVHHEPPAESQVGTDQSDYGSFDLRQDLEVQQPAVLFCGHQHKPSCWHDMIGRTLCLNPGRGSHSTVPNFIVYDDQMKRTAYYVGGEMQAVLRLP